MRLRSALLMALTLAACASQPKGLPGGSHAADLLASGGAWRLADARLPQGQPIPALFASDSNYRLQFVDGQLNISGGCNRMGAAYRIDKDHLLVDPLASTRMACDGPRMDNDAWMSRQFGYPVRMRFNGAQQLELEMLDGSKLTFYAVPSE